MTSDATTSTHAIPPDVLPLLHLPPFDALTPDQARGAVCVWGTEQLTAETAVDLGEQAGPDGRWWPRACRKHTADRAHRGLFEHAPSCEQCVDAAERCTTSRILYRLVREGRR
ncbi:hypothetical protein NC239_34680 [Streptomyces sp. G3]|uniref:hypothetical protein n=1 Tax=Streptomyces sp. G3 TaxID=690144 RepID=UPI0020309CE3|nr:hypothetical protein [Streptomyces sp. G3]MCM1943345.1 hypothetical protein [Streptomyces sp. G3]